MKRRIIAELTRNCIARLKPYSSARDEFKGEASVFLDANESPYNAPYNRYPDPYQIKLKTAISKIKGVDTNQIFVGNGSDEPIDLLIRAFCEPGIDNIITIKPTYGMYQVAASINNVELREIQLNETFGIDHSKLLSASDKNSKLIFLCSPNNPTGNILDRDELIKTIEGFDGIVVIDEAYIDFAPQRSFITELAKYSNLVVLQTLSKAGAMAGLRIGMAFASEEIIAILSKIKYPYNINMLTQEKALQLLENNPTKQWIETTISEREKMKNEMAELRCIEHTYQSDANFLLAKTTDASKLYNYLSDKGIVVRNRSAVEGCYNCIRFTVGTPDENKKLMEEMRNFDKNAQA